MDFSGLQSIQLNHTETNDRSSATLYTEEIPDDFNEKERQEYFFAIGDVWFEAVKNHTFKTYFIDLPPEQAQVILDNSLVSSSSSNVSDQKDGEKKENREVNGG